MLCSERLLKSPIYCLLFHNYSFATTEIEAQMLKFALVVAAILLHVVASQPININVDVDVKVPNSQPEAPTPKEGRHGKFAVDSPWKDAPPQPETKNSQGPKDCLFCFGNWRKND